MNPIGSSKENSLYESKVAEKYPQQYATMRNTPRSTWREAFLVLEEENYDFLGKIGKVNDIAKAAIIVSTGVIASQVVFALAKSNIKLGTKEDWISQWLRDNPDSSIEQAELAWQAYFQAYLDYSYSP